MQIVAACAIAKMHPMPEYAHIACHVEEQIVRVTFPQSRFDGHAVRELFEMTNTLPAQGAMVLVDTTGLLTVPSGGMGILVTIRKRFLATGGQLHIALPDEQVFESFQIAGMDRLLSLFDSVGAARKAFKGPYGSQG